MARVQPLLRPAAIGGAALLAGCATAAWPPCDPALPGPLTVQVVDHGWHTDLALPAAGLTGGLAVFHRLYPGLRVLLIGFGKRTFMTSPARGPGDYLVGPLPGDGVMLPIGLSAAPARAYADGGTIATIPLTPAQRDRLDRFVWASFVHDAAGRPVPIGSAFFPGGEFYAARPGYSGFYTCNTWTVQALEAAGLPVSSFAVAFAGQAMERAASVAPGGLCRFSPRASPPA